jgi:subtilisin family serine protease
VAASGLEKVDELASYSNYGECIEFAIPVGDFGEGIPTAQWMNLATYSAFNGTSAAAPVMSGLVALIKSQNPTLTPDKIKASLISSAQMSKGLSGFVRYGLPRIDKILTPQLLNVSKSFEP